MPRYRGKGTRPALERLRRLVEAVEDAERGQHHDALVRAWFGCGSYIANGWIDPEWAEHDVLEPLTHSCGIKHVRSLSGFRSALAAGLNDPDWARK